MGTYYSNVRYTIRKTLLYYRNKIYSTLNPESKIISNVVSIYTKFTAVLIKVKLLDVDGIDTSFDNVVLCIKPELQCIGINYKNIVVKNSHTKPTIAELVCKNISSTKQTKYTIHAQFKIIIKKILN